MRSTLITLFAALLLMPVGCLSIERQSGVKFSQNNPQGLQVDGGTSFDGQTVGGAPDAGTGPDTSNPDANPCPPSFPIFSEGQGKCVQCTEDDHCADNGTCNLATYTCDGTPDAGAPDAGESDAGESDAGAPDAGESDAGAPDAGQPDGYVAPPEVTPYIPPSCDTDGDCNFGLAVCLDGVCIECATDVSCNYPEGWFCHEGLCLECLAHEECGDGQFCLEGQCKGCETDDQCAGLYPDTPACHGATGTCVECDSKHGCAEGWTCNLEGGGPSTWFCEVL
jgi:hypothetical protein